MPRSITIPWAPLDSVPLKQLRLVRDQDLELRFEPDRPRSILNWTINFEIDLRLGGSSALSKTVGSGITLTDTGRGIFTVSLADTDLSSDTLTTALADGEGYVWQVKRTNAGEETLLAAGELILEEEVQA